MKSFDEANKIVHPVETQWHYSIMTEFGYESQTPSGVGFARTYIYKHPITKREFSLTTGCNGDYWADLSGKGYGYQRSLKEYLEKCK